MPHLKTSVRALFFMGMLTCLPVFADEPTIFAPDEPGATFVLSGFASGRTFGGALDTYMDFFHLGVSGYKVRPSISSDYGDGVSIDIGFGYAVRRLDMKNNGVYLGFDITFVNESGNSEYRIGKGIGLKLKTGFIFNESFSFGTYGSIIKGDFESQSEYGLQAGLVF